MSTETLTEPVAQDAATWKPRLVAFVCNWCTYTGADLAGTSRTEYPANVRIVRLPCSGRIDPHFVIRAFEQGADGVLISGCHPGDCHYTAGNYHARRKFIVLRALADFLGIESERLQFSWVSAAEGRKWADVVSEVVDGLRRVGPVAPAWGAAGELPERVLTEPPLPVPAPLDVTAALRDTAARWLREGRVDVFVGYGQGTLPDRLRPVFITSPEQAEQLVWNEHAVNNLTTYLTRGLVKRHGKVGLLVKSCDARAVVGLLQERQLEREQVALLGVPCTGVEVDGALAPKCHTCSSTWPSIVDEVLSLDAPLTPLDGEGVAAEIAWVEKMPPAQRRAWWQAQFDRCLRCYACRAACPLCYCNQCIADKNRPQWVAKGGHGQGNLAWNLVRAYHLAGRCVGCGECTRVCPANIRLDLLNAKLAQVVRDEFGYVAGTDPDVPPALTTYLVEDHEEFIR